MYVDEQPVIEHRATNPEEHCASELNFLKFSKLKFAQKQWDHSLTDDLKYLTSHSVPERLHF